MVCRYGQSAGAVSVSMQMLTNGGNTEGLFRGAFMESGGPIPTGNFTRGQRFFDAIVAQAGCHGASDTIQCLRDAPFEALRDAAQGPSIPSSFTNQVRIDQNLR